MNDLFHCRDCGHPLTTYTQEWRHKPPVTSGTCENDSCGRLGITLELETLYHLTPAQVAEYRAVIDRYQEGLKPYEDY